MKYDDEEEPDEEYTHVDPMTYEDANACDAEVFELFTKTLSKYSLFTLPRGPEDYKNWAFSELIDKVYSVKVSCVGRRNHQQQEVYLTLTGLKRWMIRIYKKTFGWDMASLKAHFNLRGAFRA
ncbi:predicted protein [Sclerotinia sclerotiorum 1980 UF-70]|uniref:Uncharacterized protein n=2 Tax=Sclerotinia sclerotiorum (strain ATCC 18683 / 1980 / Ss-1) TaxID=665079 RepID=A7EWT7_SCLS1|nr:predicted protein [Sclerotinia sclerotiorum 1980 UF-70]APA05381.1 hypothetical protein sscle_01g001510 [Sclerotinia sclerotiorum 1980 UF-70]EDN93929.1 predicted protein [Sclerotinia sclerotiorum 1980 UF-70]